MIRNGIDISAIENYSQAIDNPKLTIGIAGRITAARNPRQFNAIATISDYQFMDWRWKERNQLQPQISK
jgi:hypothetical protein